MKSGAEEFVREYNNAWDDLKREEEAVIERLKELGVRYWKYTDGWVERDELGNPLALTAVYARFNLGVKVGHKVAVGDRRDNVVVKRVSAIKLNIFGGAPKYYLEAL
jgi:hypothetical protein